MARDRKRARQRRQRQASQSPRTSQPFVADDEPTTVPPTAAEEASGPAEEAKLAIEGAEPIDADANDGGSVDVGEVYPDELDEADLGEAPGSAEGEDAAASSPARRPRGDHAAPREKGSRFGNFLRASWAELQRVQWPTRPQVAQATGVVIGFVIIAGSYLGLLDAIFGRVVKAIL